MSFVIRLVAFIAIMLSGATIVGDFSPNWWVALIGGFAWGLLVIEAFGKRLLPEVYR